MGFTWFPSEGDGSRITGPVCFSHWHFISDFVYGNRPDVDIRMLSIQVESVVGVDERTIVPNARAEYETPRTAVTARIERNLTRRRERGSKRQREISSDEVADLYAGKKALTKRERWRERHHAAAAAAEENTLSHTQASSSSITSPPDAPADPQPHTTQDRAVCTPDVAALLRGAEISENVQSPGTATHRRSSVCFSGHDTTQPATRQRR